MSRSKKIAVYGIFVIIFILAVVLYVITSPKGDVITVKSDGKVIETVEIKTITDEYEITVENKGYNKIRISQSGAEVIEADCPDKLCIDQSEKGIYPIICLPHKLVIEKS